MAHFPPPETGPAMHATPVTLPSRAAARAPPTPRAPRPSVAPTVARAYQEGPGSVMGDDYSSPNAPVLDAKGR